MGDASLRAGEGEVLLCLLPFPEPKDILDRIRNAHPKVKIVYKALYFKGKIGGAIESVPDDLFADATILCTLSALPSVPEKAPKLKFVHFISAGTDHVRDSPMYKSSDVPFTTSSGIHGPMISEWVIMQILSNSHDQKKLLEWQRGHYWGSFAQLGVRKDAVGMRLGVLGYGSIGRQVARVCKAMGMDVIAYTASPRTTLESKKDHGYIVPGTGDPDGSIPSAWYSGNDKASLHDFLHQDIDILLVSLPLTAATQHYLSAAEFAILGRQRNAFIANISRGGILHQADLLSYLHKSAAEGGLRGAALDVTDPEPLPKEHEAWDMPNLAITPHISGISVAYQDRAMQILDINMANLEAGRRLINVVDKEKGY